MEKEYKMGDAVLGRTTQAKNVGVIFSADIKVSEQCRITASKGNQVLWLIRRTITYKEKTANCTPVQTNSSTIFGILYSSTEAVS